MPARTTGPPSDEEVRIAVFNAIQTLRYGLNDQLDLADAIERADGLLSRARHFLVFGPDGEGPTIHVSFPEERPL